VGHSLEHYSEMGSKDYHQLKLPDRHMNQCNPRVSNALLLHFCQYKFHVHYQDFQGECGIPIILTYPNPARSNITVNYTIYKPSNNTLSFYNVFGEEVIRLVDSKQQDEGSYSYSFNTSDLNSGIYFTILRADSYIVTYKTVIIK